MKRAGIGVAVLVSAACGASDGAPIAEPVPAIDAPSTTSSAGRTARTTDGVTTMPSDATEVSADPQPSSIGLGTDPPLSPEALAEAIAWMVPTETRGLRLVGATREAVAECGTIATDCSLSQPTATLDYDTDDPTIRRSLRIVQGVPSTNGASLPGFVEVGEPRTLGGRAVTANLDDALGPLTIAADWSEPGDTTVSVSSFGLSWDELDAIVSSLAPVTPDSWPGGQVQPRLERCVDASSQYAPTAIPDGWQRFVLDIAPTGACGVPTILTMSLVLPGTADAPGLLETITVQFAGAALVQPGERVMIGGHEVNAQTVIGPDGPTGSSISFALDGVVVNAHGNAPPEVLDAIVASIQPLDDAAWSQLVAEKATP